MGKKGCPDGTQPSLRGGNSARGTVRPDRLYVGVAGTAEEGKTLFLSLNQSETHPSYVALTDFGDRLSEATDGRWDIRVHPNETLGAQQEVIQLVGDGSVDMAVASGTQLENLNPHFGVLNLPTVFTSIDHQMAVLHDESIVGDLFSSLEDENRLTVLGGLTQGDRNLYTRTGPIEEPEDLKGMKIRVQESDIHIKMINAMGGAATPMSYGEVYTALQSGVLDGAENNEISYVTQKHNEVAPYVAYTQHLVGLDYMLINTDLLAGMTETDRAIFLDEWEVTVQKHTDLWKKETKQAVADAEASGTTFNHVDEEAFSEALKPVVEDALTATKDHIAVDFLTRALKLDNSRAMEVVVNLVIGLFAALVLVWGGIRGVDLTWGQKVSGLPVSIGMMYLALPVSGVLTLFFAVHNALEALHGRGLPGQSDDEVKEAV